MGTLYFLPDELTVKAGTIVFLLTNVSVGVPLSHNLAIGPTLGKALVGSRYIVYRRSAVFTVEDLPAGTYTFWCEVSKHAESGMVGSLTVTP